MCGIAGLVELKGGTPDVALLRRMGDTLFHRGPDAGGVFVEGPCGLSHRRLAIIDLSGGVQPMSIDDGAFTVTFNGEIFNYIELKHELETKHGRVFATRSDTETLLHAYAVWGDDCVSRFNGQWAFAIWDKRRKRLFCSRDRIGVRPFFYTQHEGRFLFGSEVKALFAVPGVPRAFDLKGLHEVLTFWCALAPRTVWQGVQELPPGHTLVVEGGVPVVRRAWHLDYDASGPVDEDAAAQELRELLVAAADLRLRADVPVGAYVSGGLDSSVIAGIVKHHTQTPLQTFSVAFDDKELDESAYQAEVVRALGTQHASVLANGALISGAFPAVAWHMETPVVRTAPAPLYLLAGLVRQHGLKVVLTGEGADEMLGGYDIFKEAKVRRFWARQPASALRPLLLRRLYPYMKDLQAQPEAYRRAFFHVRAEDLGSPFFSHLPRWRLTQQIKAFLTDEVSAELQHHDPLEELRARLPEAFTRWHPFAQAQYLESTILLPGYILSSQGDRVAMGHSVEGRFPFLDVRVMEWAGRLPVRQKMKVLDEKHVLKRAGRDLVPPAVLQRPKQPYRAPDAVSFYDGEAGRARHDWIEERMSEGALKAAGIFRPEAAAKLIDKAKRGKLSGVKENMALVSLLSTQLVHQRFIDDFPASFAATPPPRPNKE